LIVTTSDLLLSCFYLYLFLFFFLLILPPLISTLFPYTTLFRSCGAFAIRLGFRLRNAALFSTASFLLRLRYSHGVSARSEVHKQDRKSTRLNSSHVKISYAVFCLKKKNTNDG